MLDPFNDQYFMKQAFLEAQKAFDEDEVPVGAVIVCKNQIIARGHNLTEKLTDVTAHAEIQAITAASQYLGAKYLKECTLYVTLEPCCMCAGAVYWTGIGRVVYALSEHALLGLTGDHPENPTFSLPCREVFAKGQRKVSVFGPMLEGEAAEPHKGFWS